MRPLRIIHSEAATGFGGQEHRIFKEMRAMRDRGHHLEAICQPHALLTERLRDEGFTVHVLFMDGAVNFFKGVLKVRRILKTGQYDVLNTHSRRDTILTGVAGRLAGTPLIVRTRHLARKPGSLLSYTMIPHRVTTDSEYVRQLMLTRGVPAGHVATIYTSVDAPRPGDPVKLRNELGLSADDVVVGCVAVLRRPKGHHDLLAAMLPLLHQHSYLHFVIAGDGSPLFEELELKAQEQGVSKQVHMLGRRDDVPDLLAGMDVFALATREEALGTAFVEAGAAGLPVVGTAVGGVPETMEDGVTGFLVPLDDGPALTAALGKLVSDPDLRRRMGDAGKERYWSIGRFTHDVLVSATERHYDRWLKELRS